MSDNYQDLLKVYKAILDATQEVQTYLRYHSGKYPMRISISDDENT